ncbi:hypothetical protein [Thermocrispum sp.]|uniref:hypothetical protein n=1 Tax=Thermocrispum sp. TaxID=2060768 RepID=UPI00257DBA3C|nr:hypothetical protein [Thermocrispum sp.]
MGEIATPVDEPGANRRIQVRTEAPTRTGGTWTDRCAVTSERITVRIDEPGAS